MKISSIYTSAAVAASLMLFAGTSHAADVTRTYDVTASDFVDSGGDLGPAQAFNANYTLTFDPSMNITTPTMSGLTVNSNTLPYDTSYNYYRDGGSLDTLTLATEPVGNSTQPAFFDNDDTYGTFIGGATAVTPYSYGVTYTIGGNIYSARVYSVTASPLNSAAVPEPSAWLLAMAGIGGIGLALRRSKSSMDFSSKDTLSA